MTSGEVAALLRRLSTGVYVVGVGHRERPNAFTAAWVMQVSFEPLLLALSISPAHASYPLLHESGSFAVSVLAGDQMDLARHFGTASGRDADKLAGVSWRAARRGAPILTAAAAWLECEVEGRAAAGDHEVVFGRVVDGSVVAPDARPLLYAATGNLDGSAALYPSIPGGTG